MYLRAYDECTQEDLDKLLLVSLFHTYFLIVPQTKTDHEHFVFDEEASSNQNVQSLHELFFIWARK